MNYYKIDEKTLIHLLGSNAKLNALECGGVDNWPYYGDALNNFWDGYVESCPAVIKECQYEDEIDWFDEYAIGKYELHNYERI